MGLSKETDHSVSPVLAFKRVKVLPPAANTISSYTAGTKKPSADESPFDQTSVTSRLGVKLTSGMGSCLGLEQAESRTAAATAAAILSFVLMNYSLGKEFNLISMTPTNGLVIGAWRKASSQLLRAAAASPLAR